MIRTLLICAALLAITAAVATATSPTPPTACTDSCHIESWGGGYIAPVTQIASGAQVVWGSLDITHIQSQSPLQTPESCFSAVATPNDDAPPVRFDIQDGSVVATTSLGTPDEESEECESVDFLPDGSAVLAYYCTLHPNMHGSLLIQP